MNPHATGQQVRALDFVSPVIGDTVFYEVRPALQVLHSTTAPATAGTLTAVFSAGPTTQAPASAQPATLTVNTPAAESGVESAIRIISGATDIEYYYNNTDLSDGRTYLGSGFRAGSDVSADLTTAINTDFAGVLTCTNNFGQIILTTVATGTSASVEVSSSGGWSPLLGEGTDSGTDAVSDTPSTITITGTGGVSRAFTWAWSDPGGSVTYMGQGNAGAASARNALVTAINAHAPLAAVLTAANSGVQSFTLTSVSTGTSAYVQTAQSGVSLLSATASDYGEAPATTYPWLAYGTAHPEPSRFPNHKLVAVKPDPQREGFSRYYYAATRASQETYNYEVDNPSKDMWPVLIQTWVLLRSEGVPNITSLTAPPTFSSAFTWTRMDRRVKRIGDPILDSLFVIVEVEYWDVSTNRVHYDFDQQTRLLVTETRSIVASSSTPTQSSSVVTQQDLGNGYAIRITFTASGSQPASQEGYNYEERDVGGQRWPECVATWIIPRASYTGSTMSVTAPTAHGRTWTRMWSVQERSADELMDQLFVVLRVIYWDISTNITEYEEDETLRCIITLTRSIVASSSAPSVAQYKNVRQDYLGNNWSLRTERLINGGALPSGWTEKTLVDYSIPALLVGVDVAAITDEEGRTRIGITPEIRNGFRKKLKGTLTVDFHTSDPSQPTIYQLLPTRAFYNGVTFSFDFGEVICNATTISNSGLSVVEEADIAASSPTYTTYNGTDKGTSKTIGFNSARLPGGIWRSETLTAVME